jgi:diguanylate cyclase (GGDEF)-like protein/PAS domain S-box-containing protein
MGSRILIATADDGSYRNLRDALHEGGDDTFSEERCESIAATIARVRQNGIDALLLDQSLPGSRKLAGLHRVCCVAPHLPIMLLCEPAEEPLARQALAEGAQGYLIKGQCVGYLLAQTLHSMIEQERLRRARAQMTLDSIGDAVIGTDMQGNVDYLNKAAETMTGWRQDEARGQPIEQIMPLVGESVEADGAGESHESIELAVTKGQTVRVEVGTSLIRRDGTKVPIEDSVAPIKDPDGRISGAVVVIHDVTDARAHAARLVHFAQHDPLTQLPNRVLLEDRIARAIALAQRNGGSVALMFLDLDNFKQVNDTLGHSVGDQLLQSVAQRLSSCVRSSDTVCRNGGDEFIVLLAEGHDQHDAGMIAQKILASLSETHRLGKEELYVTSSIGISVYPGDARDADALLKHADMAMYHAKEAGRNNYQFYRHDMNLKASERQLTELSLGQALRRHELILHYQPRVDLDTGQITGAQALLRWQHPSRGLLQPPSFLAIAEASGLVIPIGRRRMLEACRAIRRWQERGLDVGTMAVRLSPVELRQADFAAGVRDALNEVGLSPSCLQLEVTEDVLIRDVSGSMAALRQLSALGVELAVGDYGTGCCSLQGLLKLPIDVLKIDKSCIQNIGISRGDNMLVSALISLAGRLGYRVVADGVESQLQADFLRKERCGEAQGPLFGKGITCSQFARSPQIGMLEAGERDRPA